MTRKYPGGQLVVASHNRGKAKEIADLVAPYGVRTVAAFDLELAEPAETGTTFIANAELKARAAAVATGLVAVGDDSGLVVAALDGQPGLHSARWAGPERDFAAAMARIEELLSAAGARSSAERQAYFVCALSLAWPDGHCESFEGRVHGTLVWPPRGDKGFGYDPIFEPAGHQRTFGEMDPDTKHAISHRAEAFGKMIDACFAR